jgi:uncharacterized protein (DUF1800 family)
MACILTHHLQAQHQVYTDYIGAGHSLGITVTTSSDYTATGFDRQATGQRTIDGAGLDAKRMEASRFLAQASFGAKPEEIELLSQSNDFAGWIKWQMELPATNMVALTNQVTDQARNAFVQGGNNPSQFVASARMFQYAWWQAVLTKHDVLRQRVAAALSEILVISTIGNIRNENTAFASYYDVLMRNAFGNYRTLLREVSLHPTMGVYLTHFRNPKTDPTSNTFPDENYAREILQLFSIGLVELNPDGTVKTNAQGKPIPTYGPEDIRQLAKVFTGLGAGGITQAAANSGHSVNFNIRRNHLDYTVPMQMYDDQHEMGPKTFLGKTVNGPNGMSDIDGALNIIMEHPNVGPFVVRRLIQHMVKSNPSPAYIADVAAVFNNNGNGVKGDLAAVVTAMLLHEEARGCFWINEPAHGKLRNPTQRYVHFARAMNLTAPYGAFWTSGFTFEQRTSHLPMTSPSVFNFYLPDHQPQGPLRGVDLTGPEFQIYNATTSIGYVNEVDTWTRIGNVFMATELPQHVTLNKSSYTDLARDAELLINHLDLALCHGRMSEETRAIIRSALDGLSPTINTPEQRFDLAAFLVMISPDYTILK